MTSPSTPPTSSPTIPPKASTFHISCWEWAQCNQLLGRNRFISRASGPPYFLLEGNTPPSLPDAAGCAPPKEPDSTGPPSENRVRAVGGPGTAISSRTPLSAPPPGPAACIMGPADAPWSRGMPLRLNPDAEPRPKPSLDMNGTRGKAPAVDCCKVPWGAAVSSDGLALVLWDTGALEAGHRPVRKGGTSSPWNTACMTGMLLSACSPRPWSSIAGPRANTAAAVPSTTPPSARDAVAVSTGIPTLRCGVGSSPAAALIMASSIVTVLFAAPGKTSRPCACMATCQRLNAPIASIIRPRCRKYSGR
mmetsp:Transcript_17066/g.36860  ORF Transcript_17066/g.36860 Transcript_17066/m.36860 type:complete len:306 (-) Transcript_17066:1491-2408(-)